MPNIASKEWTKDLLKKSLAAFTPSEKSDMMFGVGDLVESILQIGTISFSEDGNLNIEENKYGYVATSKMIEEILINNIPTTVLYIGTVEGINFFRNANAGIGKVIFKEVR